MSFFKCNTCLLCSTVTLCICTLGYCPMSASKGKTLLIFVWYIKRSLKTFFYLDYWKLVFLKKKKKKDLTMTSLAYSPFPIFLATSWEIFSFSCTVNRSMEFVWLCYSEELRKTVFIRVDNCSLKCKQIYWVDDFLLL